MLLQTEQTQIRQLLWELPDLDILCLLWPKIKNYVVQVTPLCLIFLPDPNFLKHFKGISEGFPGSAILFSHLPHVKTFNKI